MRAIGISLGLVCLLSAAGCGRWKIPQDGMFPTYPAGAHIVARLNPYPDVTAVRRGDVVIYKTMRDGDRYDFIWRVVGLPGERIAIRGDAVLVNGRALPHRPLRQQDGYAIIEETAESRSYHIAVPEKPDGKSDFAEVAVPPDHVFVLGDNRHNALDSRGSGPVPFDAIVARAIW
ncbi:MAG TPA: signal peptidase I [Polyangia bacterium]|nr:signal peptidase I [Polyangia bacterium]